MTPYFLRLLPCTAGVGGTENEEYMKKIRPYLWRGGALVLAAAWAFRKGRGRARVPLFCRGFLPGMAAYAFILRSTLLGF